MHRHDESGAGFLTGFLAGAALGAMTAILLAPRSGRELRGDLMASGERARERAVDTARDVRVRSDVALEKTRAMAHEAAQSLKEAAEMLRKRASA